MSGVPVSTLQCIYSADKIFFKLKVIQAVYTHITALCYELCHFVTLSLSYYVVFGYLSIDKRNTSTTFHSIVVCKNTQG